MDNQLLQAAKIIENQLDAEIERLENLDESELEVIRKKRLDAMKNLQKQKIDWKNNGHGTYSELADEKEFFEACKKSKHVVCHFYRDATMRCKIVDKHLDELARKHIECRFVKINAEKALFLAERLKIKILPTIALIRDNKPADYIVGFAELGNTDEFDTEMLEWRIARADVIEYNGDLVNPPTAAATKKHVHTKAKATIRERRGDHDSDDDDVNNDW